MDKLSFWEKLSERFLVLAPMEGVTDVVFRQVVARAGRPEVFFTEFTNVSSFASEMGRPNALERLQFLPSEQPIVAQIWGKKPEDFEVTAAGLRDLGYKAIDINMGCPDKNVVRNGGGAGLIRYFNEGDGADNPDNLVARIILAAQSAGLPVSVKTRLGFTRVGEWQAWLEFLLQQNLAALTVHLRTRKEMSKVVAHFELIPEIVSLRNEVAPKTKLIINGDIADRMMANELMEGNPGVDGVMIGRGVFTNPFCFAQPRISPATKAQLLDLLNYHLDLWEKYHTDGSAKFEPLKRFFKIYVRDFPGASEIREKMMAAKTVAEVRGIIG